MTQKTKILIVEDDDWLAQHYERILGEAGYQVSYVSHGLAAIESLDREQPEVLLVDVFLAGPNAFTLLHELQSHKDLAAIPVILCTNVASAIAEEDVALYGVRHVLDKTTMTSRELVTTVRKVTL